MRTFLVLGPLVLAGCPGDTDEGGCPFDLLEAVGSNCSEAGLQCGETSTCEACTADPTGCTYLECAEGTWVELSVEAFCGT